MNKAAKILFVVITLDNREKKVYRLCIKQDF